MGYGLMVSQAPADQERYLQINQKYKYKMVTKVPPPPQM